MRNGNAIGLLAFCIFVVGCSQNDDPKSIETIFSELLSSSDCTDSTQLTLIPGGPKQIVKGQNSSFSFSIPKTHKDNVILSARVCPVASSTISYRQASFPITDVLHLTNVSLGSEGKIQLPVTIDSSIAGVSEAVDYRPQSRLFQKEKILSSNRDEGGGFLVFLSEINEPEAALFGTSQDFISELQSEQGALFGIKDIGKAANKAGAVVNTFGKSASEKTVRIGDKFFSGSIKEVRDKVYAELAATPAGMLCSVTLTSFALTTAIAGGDVELPFSLQPAKSSVCSSINQYTPTTVCGNIEDQAFKEACKYTFSDFSRTFLCISSKNFFKGFEFLLELEGCDQGDSLAFCLFFNNKQLCALAALILTFL